MRTVLACGLLILAGCDGGGGEPTKVTTMKAGSPYIDRLKALNELNRGLALRRAIQDGGERCKKIERSAYQEDYKNLSMWTATCSDSGDWALFIAPNGDVQIRSCKDAATLKLPSCREGGAAPSAAKS